MSEIADRLRRLQTQAGRMHASPSAAPRDSIGAQLRALLARRNRAKRALDPPAGVRLCDGLYLVEHREPATYARAIRLPWAEADETSSENYICFDTETTGLAGGVGTKAFMIGTAQWQRGELLTRQLYLTALAGEAAMLSAFAESLPRDAILVSYNGRSYDVPLLKGRYRIHRQTHPFERAHMDLLHPTRRAYRGVWENCRLATIERNVLGVTREDDLPGAEAPAAWLAFLRGLESRSLARVLTHNRVDLKSLAALLGHFNAESAI
ncbi:MAG: ribonuclease H-like domain-containing protein [Rhodanobacteraceae bacterium]